MALPAVVLVKTTLIDFPGRVAASLFIPGCNLRCPYCHNPELVTGPIPENAIPIDRVLALLDSRRPVLGGVCISGGEPLVHPEIGYLVTAIREMGFAVKLDTNGTFPERLASLPLDFIAMDLKTSPSRYHAVMGCSSADSAGDIARRVVESAEYVVGSGIRHEFRTTMVPEIVGPDDLTAIAELTAGADLYVLTEYRDCLTLDPEFPRRPPYSRAELADMARTVEGYGVRVKVRYSNR